MVRSLKFLAAVAAVADAACAGGECAGEEADSALLQTTRKAQTASAVAPEEARQKFEQRAPLVQELDLEAILRHRGLPRRQSGRRSAAPADKAGRHGCAAEAESVFNNVAKEIGLASEMKPKELAAFKARFTSAMKENCKSGEQEQTWLEAAARELERQKPVMTEALAASLNKAGIGFETQMADWLLHETPASFEGRLGMMPVPEGQESILNRPPKRTSVQLPSSFRAQDKWPVCENAILRVHNQGHCGSCWAFGGLASVDARMCIASDGAWNSNMDILSRLHVTSCAPGNYMPGADGCQGGWPHWGMEMVGRAGVVSSACLPYYIAGEGTEHFQQQDAAPPCETHCQMGYSRGLQEDLFSVAGAERYDWLTQVHGDAAKMHRAKEAMYVEGPVAFAFNANHQFMGYRRGVFSVCTGRERANHAVYAYGWGNHGGVEFLEASNSWGPNWGNNGHFQIHFRCVTDIIIPGTMEGVVVSHDVGTVDSNVAPDPNNENWPWKGTDECPFENGCVTDMGGAGDYTNNEECVSKALNGKSIEVVQFDTEAGYDILTINGNDFSGSEQNGLDVDSISGMTVDENGIKFKADSSITSGGFKICDATSECPFAEGADGKICVMDPGRLRDYGNNQACTSNRLNGQKVRVNFFETESGYDKVTINGYEFSGSAGHGLDVDLLTSLTVEQGISFQSDYSVTADGFSLCAA